MSPAPAVRCNALSDLRGSKLKTNRNAAFLGICPGDAETTCRVVGKCARFTFFSPRMNRTPHWTRTSFPWAMRSRSSAPVSDVTTCRIPGGLLPSRRVPATRHCESHGRPCAGICFHPALVTVSAQDSGKAILDLRHGSSPDHPRNQGRKRNFCQVSPILGKMGRLQSNYFDLTCRSVRQCVQVALCLETVQPRVAAPTGTGRTAAGIAGTEPVQFSQS